MNKLLTFLSFYFIVISAYGQVRYQVTHIGHKIEGKDLHTEESSMLIIVRDRTLSIYGEDTQRYDFISDAHIYSCEEDTVIIEVTAVDQEDRKCLIMMALLKDKTFQFQIMYKNTTMLYHAIQKR